MADSKISIEKNTVQETLVIPLYGRKMCSQLYPRLFRDDSAQALMEKIDYDFSALAARSQGLMHRFGFLEVAMRQTDLAWEVRDYLKTHPRAAVVNLGCGLDDTGRACDNGLCKIYNLDFPDVIALRHRLLPPGPREENVACDLNDVSWFEKIDASGGAVFFAAGVFYYFLTDQVRALVYKMAEAFPGGRLVFDGAGKAAVNLDSIRQHSGRGRVFRRFQRPGGAGRVEPPAAGLQPRLYAGLSGPEGPVGQRLFPLPGPGGGRKDEDADHPPGFRRREALTEPPI